MNEMARPSVDEQALDQALSDYASTQNKIIETQTKLRELRETLIKNKRVATELIAQMPDDKRAAFESDLNSAEMSGQLRTPSTSRPQSNIYTNALVVRIERIAHTRLDILAQQQFFRDLQLRSESFLKLANDLVDDIGPELAVSFRQRLLEMNRDASAIENSQVSYQAIVDVISTGGKKKRDWRVVEVVRELPGVGKKTVYNALQWGTQSGRLVRVSHGRYRHADMGWGIETGEDS